MSWIWSSSSEKGETSKQSEKLPSEDVTYSNAFVPDKEEVSFGSAFADPEPSTSTNSSSSDSFSSPFTTGLDMSTGSDSFYPVTSEAPRVNFDAMGTINAGTIAPAIGLPHGVGMIGDGGGVDYVFSDDYMDIRRKSFGEQLQYLTGAAFLGGAFLGGGYGAFEGLRASAGKNTKLRLNAVLNATGKRGIAASNGLAVVALLFTFAEGGIYQYASDETAANYALAGAATGALFKSTRGLRAMGMSSAAGAAIALATVYLTRQGTYGRGLQGIL